MELPPQAVIRDLVTRYACQQGLLAGELGERPLVLPNSEFFPDKMDPTADGAKRLLTRMQRHAGMLDIPVNVRLVESAADSRQSCGTGACGPNAALETPRLEERDDGWLLNLSAGELRHPVGLTTSLARTLAMIFMIETLPDGAAVRTPAPVTQDLTGVTLGFGVLLMEGAHIYSKSCGGPSIQQLTQLSLPQLGIATALFAALTQADLKRASKTMSTTQRSVANDARVWLEANEQLTHGLRHAPDKLALGDFLLNEPKEGGFRLFGRKRSSTKDELEAALLTGSIDDSSVALLAEELGQTAPRRTSAADDDDLSALVAQSLAESQAG